VEGVPRRTSMPVGHGLVLVLYRVQKRIETAVEEVTTDACCDVQMR
jgi:hypothetical protein